MKRFAAIGLLILALGVYAWDSRVPLTPAAVAAKPAAGKVPPGPVDVLPLPWLQGVTTTSVYVLVEAEADSPPVAVEYGPTNKYGSKAVAENTQGSGNGSAVVHNIKLAGLTPNTVYHYRVRRGTAA